MTEGGREAVPTGDQLGGLLLDAKVSVPRPRQGSVSRADLIERGRASGCRVIGVTAPAGYGKSTFLAQWAGAEDRRVAWVSLDRLDDDPAVLLALLASAYARVSPGNDDLISDMKSLGLSVLGRAAPRLAAALTRSPIPFVLILDDLHEIASPACHDVLGVVISGIPRESQVVAASRSEQPHLPRLRASGDALEFGASDLALDVRGAEQIFVEAHVGISREQAVTVTQRTEGWPAGLYLAALIARDSDGAALTVSGEDRYLADYLYRESFTHLPEEIQRFLRRTAVLDQVCAPLCDALLGDSGAQEQLRRLEASSLFLIPLDRRREWYRYHALFREFLLGELRRVEPNILPKLHLRAADWYELNGSAALAVEHLLNTAERDRCIQLVATLGLTTYNAGQMSTLQRWLSALGGSAVEEYPPLGVMAGWIAALAGTTAEAERLAAILDSASFDLPPGDGTASFDSSRAMLRSMMCAGGPEAAMTDARFAVDQEPSWSPWRDTALALLAEAHLLAGNRDRAVVLFVEASTVAAAGSASDAFIVSESELAVLAMDRGRWQEAAEHVDHALGAIAEQRLHDYSVSLLAFAGAARLAVHRGDVKEAHRQLTCAMRARPSSTFALPYFAVRLRLQLAKVYAAIGNVATARHLLHEIEDIFLHRPALGALVDEVSELREILSSSAHPDTSVESPLSPAELRLLPYLQTHLTMREIGERLSITRHTVSSEVGSIYRKLGVSSRGDAVLLATALGLLGG